MRRAFYGMRRADGDWFAPNPGGESRVPLFRYATRAVPRIHIIVRNGRATLRGVVAGGRDSDLAYVAARGVPGLFEVKNELRVESEAAR